MILNVGFQPNYAYVPSFQTLKMPSSTYFKQFAMSKMPLSNFMF